MDCRHFLLNSFRKQPLGVTDISQIASGFVALLGCVGYATGSTTT